MSVKIVHAADFHLDSAFGALSTEQARQRRRESRELLTRLCNYVNQNGVDLVLLAGDLFDSDTTYRETLEALSEALGAMQARVFIAPGNHDPYSAKSPYATLSWPENVHVFTSKTVERVELPELQCAVYGAAFTAPVQDESLLAGFRAPVISPPRNRATIPSRKSRSRRAGSTILRSATHTSSAVSCAKGRRPTPTPAARRAAVSTSWAKRASLRARWSAGRPNFRLCRSRADGMRS